MIDTVLNIPPRPKTKSSLKHRLENDRRLYYNLEQGVEYGQCM